MALSPRAGIKRLTTSQDVALESFAQKMWKVGRTNSTLINFLLIREERGVGSKDREKTSPSPQRSQLGRKSIQPSGGLEEVVPGGAGRADDIWIHPAKPVTGLQGGRDHRAVGLWCMHGEQREKRA